jgi:hypothetical protein
MMPMTAAVSVNILFPLLLTVLPVVSPGMFSPAQAIKQSSCQEAGSLGRAIAGGAVSVGPFNIIFLNVFLDLLLI